MDKNLHQLDQHFQDAFGSYEAPFSASEMHGDWSQVQAQIPHSPVPHAPVKAPVWGAGKILSLAGAAAVVTTAAVILYNTLGNKPTTAENTKAKPAVEQPIASADNQVASDKNADDNSVNLNGAENDAQTSGPKIRDNAPIVPNDYFSVKPRHDGDKKIAGSDAKSYVPSNSQPSGTPDNSTPNNTPAVTDNQQKDAKVLPAPRDIYFTDTIICAGKQVGIENRAAASAENIILEWGDGNWAMLDKNQSHFYANPGKYTVKLVHGNEIMKRNITVEETPSLSFSSREDGLKCSFRNASSNNNNMTWRWDFGDGTSPKTGYSPEHQYRDTGKYTVVLTGTTRGGCMSTFTKTVNIRPIPQVWDVITPYVIDGKNDNFEVRINNESYFSLSIYSADNVLIFNSRDKNNQWDGRDKNGLLCKPGRYTYILQYTYRGDTEVRQLQGKFSIEE